MASTSSATTTSSQDISTTATTARILVNLEKMGASLRRSGRRLSSRLREHWADAPKSPKADVWRGTSYLPYGMETAAEAEESVEMACFAWWSLPTAQKNQPLFQRTQEVFDSTSDILSGERL
ncbi:hypothetical protein AYL99_00881 [Fonsecaea erecta]|uniref:Uncharacterized protein n=1 Tax=Fonsecaea erecta TaxID=1367422 RepID=A0A178ZYN4_9EURO|nr:hypothetical protein AYL99_00881 [Fonsecaea erecta]OAP64909.1 hypothetical protein AYL99_00881 [Fonsecaea erecta]